MELLILSVSGTLLLQLAQIVEEMRACHARRAAAAGVSRRTRPGGTGALGRSPSIVPAGASRAGFNKECTCP